MNNVNSLIRICTVDKVFTHTGFLYTQKSRLYLFFCIQVGISRNLEIRVNEVCTLRN